MVFAPAPPVRTCHALQTGNIPDWSRLGNFQGLFMKTHENMKTMFKSNNVKSMLNKGNKDIFKD